MASLRSKTGNVAALLLCGSAFVLAGACGSSDNKKQLHAEAGAAGASEGGNSSEGGAAGTPPAGAPNQPSAGQTNEGGSSHGDGGAAGRTGVSGEAGQAGASSGGAPAVSECSVSGSVTALNLDSEPIWQGCRGNVVRVPFGAETATATFTCCGTSTSDPAFGVPLLGVAHPESGGHFEFIVPSDAPFGNYALSLNCPTEPNEHSFAIEINDVPAPKVTAMPAEIAPTDVVQIQGENLDRVFAVRARRSSDGSYFECIIQSEGQTASSISCSFESIPESVDDNDSYALEIESESCGVAADSPTFLVTHPS